MSKMKHLLGPMRVPFLVLPPACVLLGLGTAVWSVGQVNPVYVILAFLGATAAHISVNAFNEYFDFKSGLDFKTERTPFSGGSGTLPRHPQLARQALATAIVSLIITAWVGIYFLFIRGIGLLPLGLLGLFVVFAYTPWFARNPVLCLISPGLGFGTLMVMGTDFVLTGSYSWSAFVASLVPFFLVSDLLLLNQFPDVAADESVGRRHFPILAGRRASSFIYNAFLLMAFVSVGVGVATGVLPCATLISLILIGIAVPTAIGAYRYADDIPKLKPYLGLNVVINIATPVLVAIGLFLA